MMNLYDNMTLDEFEVKQLLESVYGAILSSIVFATIIVDGKEIKGQLKQIEIE